MSITPQLNNPNDLLKQTRNRLQQRTGINYYDPDSKARALIESFVDSQRALHEETSSAFAQLQLSTSTGAGLQTHGDNAGVPRIGWSFAECTEAEENFAFFVDSGTFGTLNGGSPITVPEGTVVYSDPNHNQAGARIEFTLTAPAFLDAGASLAYASIRASVTGAGHNIGQGVLVGHDFSGYSATTGLRCVNFYPILNGRDPESEENYKYRISRKHDIAVQNSESKIRLTNLTLPGVLETKVVPGMFGIGTAAVVVLSSEFKSNPALVSAVQARLNQYKGPAGHLVAVPASEVGFTLEFRVKPPRVLTAGEQQNFKMSVEAAAEQYFRSVHLGGLVDVNDLVQVITTRYKGPVSFRSSKKQFFDNVYIDRTLSGSVSPSTELLLNQFYQLEVDEFATVRELIIQYENPNDV